MREGKLTPVAAAEGPKKSITYHDPCYLGRHNQVYSPPRELLQVIPNAELTEMPRNSERSFCCGAGGAQMWMEEKIGERINVNRTTEAVGTGADQIAVGCPFCRVMLSDGLTAMQADGSAREEVEVLDVAQLLLASVKRDDAPAPAGSGAGTAAASSGGGTATAVLDKPDTATATEDVAVNADAAATGATEAPADPAAETEPSGEGMGEPASESEDVTTDEIGEAESTAPDEDVAVQTEREAPTAQQPEAPAEPAAEDKDDDKLF